MVDARPQPALVDAPLDAQVQIVHAVVAAIAEGIGCPALHIKGPVVRAQLGLAGRRSTDVDVLVPPALRPQLIAAMARQGWQVAVDDRSSRTGIRHAVVLVHPAWTTPVDLHDRFPGIEAPPADAFERMWASRALVMVAGVPLPAPAPATQALLLLLHAARGHGGPATRSDVQLVRASLSATETHTLVGTAAELDAMAALAAVAPDLAPRGSDARHVHWVVRSRRSDGTTLWASRLLATTGFRTRLSVLRAALFPGRLGWAWLARWAKGMRALPSAILTIRRVRRELVHHTNDPSPPSPPAGPCPEPPAPGAQAEEASPGGYAWVESGDATWVAGVPGGPLCRLDGTGRLIWQAARDRSAIEEVVDEVARQAGVPQAVVADDVRRFVVDLAGLGLLPQPPRAG